jgi:hypothetical protein
VRFDCSGSACTEAGWGQQALRSRGGQPKRGSGRQHIDLAGS